MSNLRSAKRVLFIENGVITINFDPQALPEDPRCCSDLSNRHNEDIDGTITSTVDIVARALINERFSVIVEVIVDNFEPFYPKLHSSSQNHKQPNRIL
jgi:hypothetical protein